MTTIILKSPLPTSMMPVWMFNLSKHATRSNKVQASPLSPNSGCCLCVCVCLDFSFFRIPLFSLFLRDTKGKAKIQFGSSLKQETPIESLCSITHPLNWTFNLLGLDHFSGQRKVWLTLKIVGFRLVSFWLRCCSPFHMWD